MICKKYSFLFFLFSCTNFMWNICMEWTAPVMKVGYEAEIKKYYLHKIYINHHTIKYVIKIYIRLKMTNYYLVFWLLKYKFMPNCVIGDCLKHSSWPTFCLLSNIIIMGTKCTVSWPRDCTGQTNNDKGKYNNITKYLTSWLL